MINVTLVRRLFRLVIGVVAVSLPLVAGVASAAGATAEDSIVVASTTSTEQSGLFRYLLPIFQQASGIQVKVVAVGTGQALDIGRRGDADVVLVHARKAEDKFVAEGWAQRRYDVMSNDFVLLGPRSDPARIKGGHDIAAAFKRIAATGSLFASRGDRSGTHMAELAIWSLAGIDAGSRSGKWYLETGSGMGPTLNVASGRNAYTLSDRGTWIAFHNRGELEIALEGDSRLLNRYGVMLVNPQRYPHVRAAAGQRFIDWLIGPAGQAAIADFRIDGQQLFFPANR
ncbi:MAG: substrate-binding domain-containing protein [Burkholderiaceae bacterium]|nr:substrate-binding domain-containing protein [Burkholderiaceae bacterium]